MIVAAILFAIGILIGWLCDIIVLCLSSSLIFAGFFAYFMIFSETKMLHLLILIGYLFTHQTGYLLGAYLGAEPEEYKS